MFLRMQQRNIAFGMDFSRLSTNIFKEKKLLKQTHNLKFKFSINFQTKPQKSTENTITKRTLVKKNCLKIENRCQFQISRLRPAANNRPMVPDELDVVPSIDSLPLHQKLAIAICCKSLIADPLLAPDPSTSHPVKYD